MDTIKVPKVLMVTGCQSAVMTGVLALVHFVLCLLALIFRNDCSYTDMESYDGSQYFFNILMETYVLDATCTQNTDLGDTTGQTTIFILELVALVMAVLGIITSICVIISLTTNVMAESRNLVATVYAAIYAAALVVDITFAVHFGMDYQIFNSLMNNSFPGFSNNYVLDMRRMSAFFLLCVSLRFFIGHIVMIGLIIVFVSESYNHQAKLRAAEEHSIHKLGALNGYNMDNSRRQENDGGSTALEFAFHRGLSRNSRTNPAMMNDEIPPRNLLPMRDNFGPETPRDSTNRMDPWRHQSESRPFSYLADIRNMPRSSSPVVAPKDPWRNDDWGTPPPVPAPDYSPHGGRRLKPALKYM